MKMVYILLLVFVCFFRGDLRAQHDTLSANETFIKKFKELRAKKPRQFKRIENKDSLIVYGADRLRTHLLLVSSHNRVKNFHVQYMYDEDGIFCINVLHRSKWQIESGARHRDRAFYFKKGLLSGAKGNDGSDDVEFLLAEAARYFEQGTAYLKEL